MSSVFSDLNKIRDAYRYLSPDEIRSSPFEQLIKRYDLAARLLDPVLYRVYDLYYVKCLTQDSIAMVLNCSRKYVWQSIMRLKDAFENLSDQTGGGA